MNCAPWQKQAELPAFTVNYEGWKVTGKPHQNKITQYNVYVIPVGLLKVDGTKKATGPLKNKNTSRFLLRAFPKLI
jgi:hypothetical protein